MKVINKVSVLSLLTVFVILGCEKREAEVKIQTRDALDITTSSAMLNGSIIDLAGQSLEQHGFVYAISENPTVGNSKKELGPRSTTGEFSALLDGLESDTKYYFRAFAQTSSVVAYDQQKSFTTLKVTEPAVSIDNTGSITQSSFTITATVSDEGGASVSSRGFVWSVNQNPSLSDAYSSNGSGIGSFSAVISGLDCGTLYYISAYATNAAGTSYSIPSSVATTSCSADLPQVTTAAISNIAEYSAQGGGEVTSEGSSAVIAGGVCWSTSQNPSIFDQKTTDASGSGSFISVLAGLDCGTTYFVRAYATSQAGTAYGIQQSFTTSTCPVGLASVTLDAIKNISQYGAQADANVTDNGGSAVTARGICYSKSTSPTTSDLTSGQGSGTGSFNANLSGLECGTTYFIRAYATNEAGTAYSAQDQFTTATCPPGLPVVSISAISNVQQYSAQINGIVSDDGGASVTSRGVCYSTSSGPTTADMTSDQGSGTGSFLASISSLDCNTTYYVRAYATNSAGTSYSPQQSFVTSLCPVEKPTVVTLSVNQITSSTAQSSANVTDDGGATVTDRGFCWSKSKDPTLSDHSISRGSGVGSYSGELTDLDCGTTYYLRSYATNSAGTEYGGELTFTTNECVTSVTDIDGNEYPAVQIGDQTWMAENLRVTRYSNGNTIANASSKSDWDNLGTDSKAYCWYENSSTNRNIYGGIYTWGAAMNGAGSSTANPSGVQGICPSGWHIPSLTEWKEMEMYLGMTQGEANGTEYRGTDEGGKIKESGTVHWSSPNTGATNESGFTALPGGYRDYYGDFFELGNFGFIWLATDFDSSDAWHSSLSSGRTQSGIFSSRKSIGISVRCLKD